MLSNFLEYVVMLGEFSSSWLQVDSAPDFDTLIIIDKTNFKAACLALLSLVFKIGEFNLKCFY